MLDQNMGCATTILKWLNFLLIILTGVSFAAPYFPPDAFWPFIFLGLGFPILVLCNFAYVLFWLYLKKWHFILSLLCLIMSWSAVGKFIGNPFKSTTDIAGKQLKVMTYNVQGSSVNYKKLHHEFNQMITENNPDIICFQEINLNNAKLKTSFDKYPYKKNRSQQAILSKYPILQTKDLNLEKIKTSNGAFWVDIKVGAQTIRVYNLHLHSNKISTDVNELANSTELSELNDKETWRATRGILSMVKRTAAIRAKQAVKVQESIQRSQKPVIICGDFNDPPQSYSYRILSSSLVDHFEEAGKGLGFTYNGKIPFLKIDYILSSRFFHISNSKIISSEISDHKPIISTLVLPLK